MKHTINTLNTKANRPIKRSIQSKTTVYSPGFNKRDNFSSTQRDKILSKNSKKNEGFYTCENCGFQHKQKTYATKKGKPMGDGGFQIDHIVPDSLGGKAKTKNSAVLCGTCNTSKGNRGMARITGMQKYPALHRKPQLKDYQKSPNKINSIK
jgi:5-methylcytosine-specific restriction endonuclease McrA